MLSLGKTDGGVGWVYNEKVTLNVGLAGHPYKKFQLAKCTRI